VEIRCGSMKASTSFFCCPLRYLHLFPVNSILLWSWADCCSFRLQPHLAISRRRENICSIDAQELCSGPTKYFLESAWSILGRVPIPEGSREWYLPIELKKVFLNPW
jgi:hypothetical protein